MKNKKIKWNKKIVTISLCVLILMVIVGITYAYWTRSFIQTGNNINTYDCFNINFKENTEGITIDNSYPITDAEGLNSEAYEVTIENTCKTAASYNVILNKLSNSTLDNSNIKIAVDNVIKLLSNTSSTTSTVENAIDARIIGTGILAGKASKTIAIRSWMDENTSIEEGSNKVFANKITIEAAPKAYSSFDILLTNNTIYSEEPDFTGPEPAYIFKEAFLEEVDLTVAEQYISSSYKFHETSGYYELINPVKKTVNSSDIGKYMLLTEYPYDLYIYKIKAVNNNQVTVDTYYNEKTSETKYQSGIYSTLDDDGTSYYYRGAIKNNYVSFANQSWRIVRINGDNTLRLILDDVIGTSTYNNSNGNIAAKYFGYTYDNDHICTNANPCTKDTGTSSDIKNYLEEWYQNNLADYDDKIELGSFCNDTSLSSEVSDIHLYFKTDERLKKLTPSLKCPDTSENYGGKYKLKIGLLTADEAYMAGTQPSSINDEAPNAYISTNYLYMTQNTWTMSPIILSPNSAAGSVAGLRRKINFLMALGSTKNSVWPVINLKSNVKIVSGDGTVTNPYIVE